MGGNLLPGLRPQQQHQQQQPQQQQQQQRRRRGQVRGRGGGGQQQQQQQQQQPIGRTGNDNKMSPNVTYFFYGEKHRKYFFN